MTQGTRPQNPSPDRRPHCARMSLGKISVSLLMCFILLGCGKSMEDLHHYVEEVKARKSSGIKPPPESPIYKPFAYQGDNRRDPFDSSVIANGPNENGQIVAPDLSPDPDRSPEFLESFPLDTLRMVGTLAQGPILWALVRTPDATIQRVTGGNYMGQNYGRINRISDSGIDLTEIVPDGFGNWKERKTYVALSDNSS